jgi:hypothetical protein
VHLKNPKNLKIENNLILDCFSPNPVFEIKITGNIPFVTSEDVSLVLIDTPGPNNARDDSHQIIQRSFLNKSSKDLVLYIMTGEFGTNDDDSLLKYIAESMKVGGKQSKDRFLFVVNKLDGRKKEDGDIDQTLDRVRLYLKNKGFENNNPNLFPTSALAALDIKLLKKGVDLDDDVLDETNTEIRKLNRSIHLEDYATLPLRLSSLIKKQVEVAKAEWDGPTIENPDEALIHSGIVSIEAAIRQYVQKYAKSSKIKNLTDTFESELIANNCFENTVKSITENKDKAEKIRNQILFIRRQVDDINNAKQFKEAVNQAAKTVCLDSEEKVIDIIKNYQSRITKLLKKFYKDTIDVDEAVALVTKLTKQAGDLELDFKTDLDELIQIKLEDISKNLLQEYKNKLSSLISEIDFGDYNFAIDPLKFMSGEISFNRDIKEFIKQKKVEDGKEWVKNYDKAWYKPWTWFDEDGYLRIKYKKVKYIESNELAQEFFAPVQKNLTENGQAACRYTEEKSQQIAKWYYDEFNGLDDILREKLNKLEKYTFDEKESEQALNEAESRLSWLKNINGKLEEILEI